jgi:hypothetical protein
MKEVTRIKELVSAAKMQFRQKEMFFEYFPVRYEGV